MSASPDKPRKKTSKVIKDVLWSSSAQTNPLTENPLDAKPVVAGVLVRLLAGMYDLLLILALVFMVAVILIYIGTTFLLTPYQAVKTLPNWYLYGVMFPAYLLAVLVFYGVFWRKAGQTLGMQTWRLKTITVNGDYLTWRQTILRCTAACLLPVVCGLVGYTVHHTIIAATFSFVIGFLFNYLLALFQPKHLAVHDILSATLTVRMPAKK